MGHYPCFSTDTEVRTLYNGTTVTGLVVQRRRNWKQCHRLAACGWQINTAFIERVNRTSQHIAAVGRHVTTLCKCKAGLRQQLALYLIYYNCCLPHTSLHRPLQQPA